MNTKNKLLLKKSLAIFTIYLIISLTFFTAKAFAAINYEISGDKKVSHFARRTNDNILLNTTSESNVSFISNTNTLIPLSCVNNSDGIIQCIRSFPSSDISNNVINPVFKLQQISDTQTIIKAQLHIDNTSPQINAFEVQRVTDGLNFVYDFTDYLANISENIDGTTCIGSGIGTISLIIPQNTAYNKIITIPTQNCTVSGNYFVNFSNSNTKMDVDKIDYILTLTDRVGNVNVLKGNVSGDFKAPEITNTYKIMQGNTELTKFSQIGGLKANVQVTIEDSNLDKDNVYADLSNLNSALKTAYTRMKAECITDSQNKVYTCVFKDIELRPLSTDASIVVSAIDTSGNIAIKTLPKNIELSTGAGQLLYIGPLKNHCTNDLTKCYVTSGKQIFTAELSSESNYNHSLIYIGINSETRFAACNLNNTWKCIGTYDIPKGTVDLNVFLAESYDDYGNPLNSPITNRLLIDDIKPKNLTKLEVINSNNNIDCAVYGDELTFNVKVQEETTEPKIYVDTSKFTTQDIQNGVCNLGENGNWDCTLTIKDFISTATTNWRNKRQRFC